MQRESPYGMVPIAVAQQMIAAQVQPLGVEQVDSLGAYGRVLAEDVYADGNLPDMAKSAVDGYALCAADGMIERRVLAEVVAGTPALLRVGPATATRIMTGAPLPEGADSVIMVEQTEECDGLLRIRQPVVLGDNVHTIGQDVAVGALVLARGVTIGAAEVGLLAAVGRVRVAVYRRPRVAVLSTGDEVYEPHQVPSPGGIRDSNRYALLAAAHEAGCEVCALGIVRDDVALQRAAILEGVRQADVVLTSGGVSMGTRDLIKPLLAELGTLHFGRIAFKPGKPTTFATVQGRLVFGLPGFPVSSLVSFEVFVRPALRRMQGDARPERPRIQVMLGHAITAPTERPEYQRAIVGWKAGRLVAQSTGSQGSSRLLSLRGANALVIVPATGERYDAGAVLEALLVGPLVELP